MKQVDQMKRMTLTPRRRAAVDRLRALWGEESGEEGVAAARQAIGEML
jgi:hypothetical protein